MPCSMPASRPTLTGEIINVVDTHMSAVTLMVGGLYTCSLLLFTSRLLPSSVHSKVACETAAKTGMIMIFGEITTKAVRVRATES